LCEREIRRGKWRQRRRNVQRSTSNVQRSTGEEEEMMGEKVFDLEDRLLDYSAEIVRTVEELPRTLAGSHVARQLLGLGTSPFAHHGEAQSAESRRDFIHKMSVCLKELREANRWLWLIHRVSLLHPVSRVDPMLQETSERIRIFDASVRTAERNEGRSDE
jgi:four helix bundle protein